MRILTLDRRADTALTEIITRAAYEAGLSNVFNASVVCQGDTLIATFRAAISPRHKPFHAFLLLVDATGHGELTDMTDSHASLGMPKVADPKLVALDGNVYVTFNTGNVRNGSNDIYLQRVTPSLGPLQRCLYDRRRPVEKNWGFFLTPDGTLGALYAMAPFTTIRLADGELGATEALSFVTDVSHARIIGEFPDIHVGSQPFMTSRSRALVIVNQRFKIQRPLVRRMYVGRLAEIDLVAGAVTRLSGVRLIDSARSMLLPPQRGRPNPVLWSATYFSGLSGSDGELLLSYGINDTSFGIARLPVDALWQ